MDNVLIGEKMYTIFGKVKGSNDNKFNRAAKLAHKFDGMNEYFSNNPFTTGHDSRCSLAILMLMHTGIRVGNEDSAEGYMTNPHPNQKDKVSEFVQTYGLTTLKPEHFIYNESNNTFDLLFLGKKSVENTFNIDHPAIVSGLKALLAGCSPDKYVMGITDSELTKFIKTYVGEQFSPKDFRCMRANIMAWEYLSSLPEMFFNKTYAKFNISGLYKHVASMLNNTPAVCKKNYVSPEIIPYMQTLFN